MTSTIYKSKVSKINYKIATKMSLTNSKKVTDYLKSKKISILFGNSSEQEKKISDDNCKEHEKMKSESFSPNFNSKWFEMKPEEIFDKLYSGPYNYYDFKEDREKINKDGYGRKKFLSKNKLAELSFEKETSRKPNLTFNSKYHNFKKWFFDIITCDCGGILTLKRYMDVQRFLQNSQKSFRIKYNLLEKNYISNENLKYMWEEYSTDNVMMFEEYILFEVGCLYSKFLWDGSGKRNTRSIMDVLGSVCIELAHCGLDTNFETLPCGKELLIKTSNNELIKTFYNIKKYLSSEFKNVRLKINNFDILMEDKTKCIIQQLTSNSIICKIDFQNSKTARSCLAAVHNFLKNEESNTIIKFKNFCFLAFKADLYNFLRRLKIDNMYLEKELCWFTSNAVLKNTNMTRFNTKGIMSKGEGEFLKKKQRNATMVEMKGLEVLYLKKDKIVLPFKISYCKKMITNSIKNIANCEFFNSISSEEINLIFAIQLRRLIKEGKIIEFTKGKKKFLKKKDVFKKLLYGIEFIRTYSIRIQRCFRKFIFLKKLERCHLRIIKRFKKHILQDSKRRLSKIIVKKSEYFGHFAEKDFYSLVNYFHFPDKFFTNNKLKRYNYISKKQEEAFYFYFEEIKDRCNSRMTEIEKLLIKVSKLFQDIPNKELKDKIDFLISDPFYTYDYINGVPSTINISILKSCFNYIFNSFRVKKEEKNSLKELFLSKILVKYLGYGWISTIQIIHNFIINWNGMYECEMCCNYYGKTCFGIKKFPKNDSHKNFCKKCISNWYLEQALGNNPKSLTKKGLLSYDMNSFIDPNKLVLNVNNFSDLTVSEWKRKVVGLSINNMVECPNKCSNNNIFSRKVVKGYWDYTTDNNNNFISIIDLKISNECKNCGCKVCRKCNRKHHGYTSCKNHEWRMTLLALRKLGMTMCPTCNTYVERIDGCDHMTCICGNSFCYKCGKLNSHAQGCGYSPHNTVEENNGHGPPIEEKIKLELENKLKEEERKIIPNEFGIGSEEWSSLINQVDIPYEMEDKFEFVKSTIDSSKDETIDIVSYFNSSKYETIGIEDLLGKNIQKIIFSIEESRRAEEACRRIFKNLIKQTSLETKLNLICSDELLKSCIIFWLRIHLKPLLKSYKSAAKVDIQKSDESYIKLLWPGKNEGTIDGLAGAGGRL